jgi:hypothetical protein
VTAAERLLGRLDGVTGSGPTWRARCPAHGSRGATLAVREVDDGRVLLHCFAGCEPAEVLGAIGLGLGDLFPDRPAEHRQGAIRKRDRWDPIDLLRALRREADVIRIAAEDLARGQALAPGDLERVREAHRRIVRIVGLAA